MKTILTFSIILITFLSSYAQGPGKDTTSSRKILPATWSLVAVEKILPDKSKVLTYGENPQDLLVFDPQGNYAIQNLKPGRPKIVANDKNKATADENAVLVQGNNAVEILKKRL